MTAVLQTSLKTRPHHSSYSANNSHPTSNATFIHSFPFQILQYLCHECNNLLKNCQCSLQCPSFSAKATTYISKANTNCLRNNSKNLFVNIPTCDISNVTNTISDPGCSPCVIVNVDTNFRDKSLNDTVLINDIQLCCPFIEMLNILTYVTTNVVNYLEFISIFCFTQLSLPDPKSTIFTFNSPKQLWNVKHNFLTCDIDLGLPNRGLRIGHLNVRHLVPKVDQLDILLTKRKREIDILGLTETFLKKHRSNKLINISGYVSERKDRKKRVGGGVAVYLSENVPFIRREDLETTLEVIWLEIQLPKSKPFILGFVYRPPNAPAQWVEDYEDMLENVYTEEKEMIILGDFNINLADNIPNRWAECCETFTLTQLIDKPTRITESTSTLIDHVYSTNTEKIFYKDVIDLSLSDHKAIFISRKGNYSVKKGTHKEILYRDMKPFDIETFCNELCEVDFSGVSECTDPNTAVDIWTQCFLKVLDHNAPIKRKRVKRVKQPEWLNEEILFIMRERQKNSNKSNSEVRQLKNSLNGIIHKAKKDYLKHVIDNDNRKNPWKIIDKLNSKPNNAKPTSLFRDNKNITDPSEIAVELNNFFYKIS